MALCSGVHPDTKFARRLTKEKPATLPDFFHEAGKYIRLEDAAIEGQSGQQNKATHSNAPVVARDVRKNDSRDNAGGKKGEKCLYRPGPRFDAYTPLNETIENISRDTQDEVRYKRPPHKKKPDILNLRS